MKVFVLLVATFAVTVKVALAPSAIDPTVHRPVELT